MAHEADCFDKSEFKKLLTKAIGDRTMTEFAKQSGVNRTYISKYMNARLDAPPTPEILKRIANAAANNVTYLDLMKAAGYIDCARQESAEVDVQKPLPTLFEVPKIMERIDVYCYLVARGAKPAAMLPVPSVYLDRILKYVDEQYQLQTHLDELGDHWVTLWVFKHPHIRSVIESLPEKPESVFDEWVLGKLFGYDEHSIGEYLALTYPNEAGD